MFTEQKNDECSSELLVITEFFFAIPSHNANTERVFSLTQIANPVDKGTKQVAC